MSLKLKQRITQYLNKNSKLKIAGDIFFYLLIILLIIPGTRREIISTVKRLTLMKPRISETAAPVSLIAEDYLFTIEDQEGRIHNFSRYTGEVMFINFWATWCPPCRAEMPSIQRLYDKYGSKVKFILITSEEATPVNTYINKYNYSFPVYFQRSNLPPSFRVSAIPHTYIIDREGRILLSKTGAAKWDSEDFMEFLDSIL